MRNRESNQEHANEIVQICHTGQLEIDSRIVDISDLLHAHTSIEYRRADLDQIHVARYRKADVPCHYEMTHYGSDEVPFHYPADHLCILNFASSKHAGGGFVTGAMAQEEALCHASNLYPCLCEHESFYAYNREHIDRCQYTDGMIYTKGVVFFCNRRVNVRPQMADVITCAAPNWSASRSKGVTLAENRATMSRRLEQVLKAAIVHEVKALVLGAFGCGVFQNDANDVAGELFRLLVEQQYGGYFEKILFAMNSDDARDPNVAAFQRFFGNLQK